MMYDKCVSIFPELLEWLVNRFQTLNLVNKVFHFPIFGILWKGFVTLVTQPFDLCLNIYFQVMCLSNTKLLSSGLWGHVWQVKEEVETRMSSLAEECGVRDFIQCQEDREGKLGDRSVNNEVKVIQGSLYPCQPHVHAQLPPWVQSIIWGKTAAPTPI